MSGVYPVPMQRLTQYIFGCVTGLRLGHDNKVHSGQGELRLTKTFPNAAFNAVPVYRSGGNPA